MKRILALLGVLAVILAFVLILRALFKDAPEEEASESLSESEIKIRNEPYKKVSERSCYK